MMIGMIQYYRHMFGNADDAHANTTRRLAERNGDRLAVIVDLLCDVRYFNPVDYEKLKDRVLYYKPWWKEYFEQCEKGSTEASTTAN